MMPNESGDLVEGIDEAQLITLLKEKGLDKATQRLLRDWANQAEAEADAIARGKGPLAEEARVNLELRRAELYSRADLNPVLQGCALSAWDDAIQLAIATGKESLIERVRDTAHKRGYMV